MKLSEFFLRYSQYLFFKFKRRDRLKTTADIFNKRQNTIISAKQ